MEILQNIPAYLYPVGILFGGLIVVGLGYAVKLTHEIGGIVKTVSVIRVPSIDGQSKETNVLGTLVEYIPKMSASLNTIAEAMPIHTEYLEKIATTTARTDRRSIKITEKLNDAISRQKRHYKKIDDNVRKK